MGQITIEVPQAIERNYRITSREHAEKLLAELENADAAAHELSAEDLEDVRAAKDARAEYERTGESYTVAELRGEFGL